MIEASGLGVSVVPVRHRQRRDRSPAVPWSQHSELRAYLAAIAGEAQSGRYLEIRWRVGTGMRRRFVPSLSSQVAAPLIASLARRTDVFVGVALREGDRHGGASAISRCGLLHLECDRPDGQGRVDAFPLRPQLLIASGTPGHVHAYWRLAAPVDPERAQAANRALACRIGGDLAAVDAARILRPPGTVNHKHRPPRAVRLLTHTPGMVHEFASVAAELAIDTTASGSSRLSRSSRAQPTNVPTIPAAEYVRVLVGLEPNSAGKILCPFHRERTPSLQLYADNHFYCFGRGCGRGGTIVDFAAALWGLEPRGEGYVEIVRRLRCMFPGV
jgi:CHC2-type zinc finger protein/DNA primase RepB-like protein